MIRYKIPRLQKCGEVINITMGMITSEEGGRLKTIGKRVT
jgi:hypothetical protein